jgi:ribonuclease Y
MDSYIGVILAGISFIAVVVSLVLYFRRVAQLESSIAVRQKELELQGKEEIMKRREEIESQSRDKAVDIARREAVIETREIDLEHREQGLNERAERMESRHSDIVERERRLESDLSQVAKMTREQARTMLLQRIEHETRDTLAKHAKEVEAEALADCDRKARQILLEAMQRCAVEYVSEATLSVVMLPSEDMKGRIIGREGRNIRSFEQVTGVDLIIDDTPEAVVISCFDPVRREIARRTLEELIEDGRIHPTRIEELFQKATEEVAGAIGEAAREAIEVARVSPASQTVMNHLGRLRYRSSYGQNVLDHSIEVSRLAGLIALELDLNVEVAKRAGLFHDIGKALGPEWEGPHALTGMAFLQAEGENNAIIQSVGAHHHESESLVPEAVVVTLADILSASRPGSRKENLENYVRRMTSLEKMALSFEGVERAYAVQAGRELRLIVKPAVVDDAGATRIAQEVVQKISQDHEYPGQIKVTVIREVRVQEIAK